jgi:uncharacterized membrane protein
MDKIDIQFDKNLDYIIELKGELVHARDLMSSGDDSLKWAGANYVLNSYINKYSNLSENAKNHLNENINDLEKMAVKIVVEQGYSDIINQELLKKYGYSKISGDKFGE